MKVFLSIYNLFFKFIRKITNKKLSNTFTSYLIIGSSGFILQLFLTALLTKVIGLINSALFLSMFIATNWNFYFFNKITFKKNKLIGISFLKGLTKLYLSTFISLVINFIITSTIYRFILDNLIFSQIIGVTLVVMFNYFIAKKIIWKN